MNPPSTLHPHTTTTELREKMQTRGGVDQQTLEREENNPIMTEKLANNKQLKK